MKRFIAMTLAAVMAISMTACAKTPQETKAPETTAAPATEAPTTQAPTETAPQTPEMTKVVFLNNAFEGLETSKQCYNAKEYHASYKLGEIVDDNFWFKPAEDVVTKTVAYTDFYADECDYATLQGKYISFSKDNMGTDYEEYDIYVGPNQKESSDVKYKGFIIIGSEALLLMQEDGWQLDELFADIEMVEADSYDLVCADDYTYSISKDKLAETKIVWKEGDESKAYVDCIVPGESWVLENIKYIVPTGLTADAEPSETGISKINVALSCDGVFETEAPYKENRAGVFYTAVAVSDLLAKFEVPACEEVTVISHKDGYTAKDAYELFAQKYMAFQGPNEKGDHKEYFTLGRVQPRNEGVTNVGYYLLEEVAFAYVTPDGLTVADVFEAITMAQADNYEFAYVDGTTKVMSATEAQAVALTQDDCTIVSITAAK